MSASNPSDPLESKILKWLDTQGYPLEMRVASKLRALSNFQLTQSIHYIDPESGTSREIDLVCSAHHNVGYADINFVFECKQTDKPWIIFSSEEAGSGYFRHHTFGVLSDDALSETYNKILSADDTDFLRAKEIPWFWKVGKRGYSVAQAFQGNCDVPYSAAISALKASLWLTSQGASRNPNFGNFSFSFPVVVTTSPLYECYLGDDNKTILKRIEFGFLFFSHRINENAGTFIQIVTENGLEQLIQDMKVIQEELFKIIAPAIKNELEEFQQRNS